MTESFLEDAQQADAPRVPLRNKNLRIMCVGDSITTGGNGGKGTLSYRSRLVQHLRGNKIDMVGNCQAGNMEPPELNRGEFVPGKTIEEITLQVKEPLQEWRPNLVLLHIGTNDCAQRKQMETIGDRVERLMDLIMEKCPDAVLIVAQIIPCCFRGDEVISFNRQVAQFVNERSANRRHIMSVDMYEPFEFEGHPNYLADVAHPNQYGHVVLADKWMEAIEKANGLGWIGEPMENGMELKGRKA